MYSKDIPERIKYLRKLFGYKQSEIAHILEISESAYCKLEQGTRRLTAENCINLSDLYEVSCDFILKGIGDLERVRKSTEILENAFDNICCNFDSIRSRIAELEKNLSANSTEDTRSA